MNDSTKKFTWPIDLLAVGDVTRHIAKLRQGDTLLSVGADDVGPFAEVTDADGVRLKRRWDDNPA